MNKFISLDLRCLLWKHLLIIEKKEIIRQMPKILSDPNTDMYRFIKSDNLTWSIPNAMTIPLKTKSMALSGPLRGTENGRR